MINVGEVGIELHAIHVDLIKAVTHVDGEDAHHLLRHDNHGGGGHRIDLVSEY
jgi:hypothetical protein